MAEAFEKLIRSTNRKPVICSFDAGREFTGTDFQKMLKKHKIYSFVSTSDMKCSVIERWNKTLKSKMWKWFTYSNSFRWIDELDNLVSSYNNSVHRTIGYKPSEVTSDMEPIIAKRIQNNAKRKKRPFKFEIDDRVRLSKYKGTFEKGYEANWTREIFVIASRESRLCTNQYKVKDLNGEAVKGIFYESQLLKIIEPSTYKIDKILKWRKLKSGKKEALVRFLGYSEEFDQWINESDIENI